MQEFLDLLRMLPKPLRYLGVVFLLIPIVYVVSRMLGVPQYWWVFVLGLLVIAIVLSIFDAIVQKRERGQAKAFEGELRQDAQRGGASREEVRHALGDLAAKWSEAVTQLKQAGLDIYSLPWYLLIGEPQSGKSTTLKNSGLEFPVGADALSGAGGTRNCDWWFANEAVILDTAGRFTFQEEAAPDQAEWGSFLKLLRKYRKFCPINGVLVVIPATSLLEDTPEEQERKAQNIRQKLLNVQRVLQIRFPVFVMVTKADRMLGFSEFFTRLDPVDQQQLFGWSNPEGATKAYNPEGFDAVYDEIVTRLYRLRLKFLADEENPAASDKLYVFPEEFRALKTSLARYFKTIFQQTRFDEPFAFRGFYFSSGVQQGRPIAQATRDLLSVPGGAAESVLENLESIFKKSRAFFIRHFYEKKVFPEQGLIARTAAAEAKSRKTLWIVRILGVLVVLLFLGGMVPAYRSLQGVLNPIRRSVREAKDCVAKGCSVADSYRIANDIQKERELLSHKGWTFALFLRGTRSNELVSTLSAIQRKVYLTGVVAPLLAETEGRMGALDWATYHDYRPFFDALKAELDWVAAKKPPLTGPIARPEDLRALPLVDFCRRTRGMKPTARSQEIDDWLKGPEPGPTDPRPDEILAASMRGAEGVVIPVPDPDRPVTAFERFWTVENLARWDFTLQDGLAKYAALYGQMTTLPKAAPPQYLAQFVDVGTKFQQNYDATTKHMATPRPGEKGFPGATLEQWKTALRQDYSTLLKWKPIAPGRISEPRREEILARMDVDHATLVARQSELAYLLDAASPRPAWSKPAATLASALSDLTNYSNLTAYAATDDGKLLDKLAAMTAWAEKPKAVDEWRNRQEAPQKAILQKTAEMSSANPDPKFLWTDRRPTVEQTAALALLWRTLPTAQSFFGDALVARCPPNICYTPEFARAMVSSASLVVGFGAKQQSVAAFDGVAPAIQALAGSEKTYLQSYIDRMGGGGGGGGGFAFPGAAAAAGSWSGFQRAIASWTPTGGGGGAAPVDTGGQLTLADIQTFVNANEKLADVLEYYKAKVERPKAAAASTTVSPDLLAAAEQFRTCVAALPGEPLKAWKQLANAEGGVSLKQYKSFSENPRVRSIPLANRLKNEVEFHGAHLMRDAIRPVFAQREPVAWGRLSGCCLGKFPFINEIQLQTERAQLAAGGAYARSGPTARIDLPTISGADITGPLQDVGQLAAEFALDPIFAGEAREFDFVGEHRPILGVARAWERFLFGTPGVPGQVGGPPREHKIEIRSVERPLPPGVVFIGDRVGLVMLFDGSERLRPSTDIKTGRTPPPYSWRLASADAPLTILGQNEDARGGWKGTLDITGGPLKLFYYVRRASEDRRPGQDERVWDVRVEIPDAERASTRLQGVFELRFDDPLPGVIPR